jgi:hypothetical protein
VIVRGKIYTNPAGSRWLEYKNDYNYGEEKFRNELVRKCYEARLQAAKNKQPFDEEAFKKEVDEKYKNRDWRQIVEERKSKKDKK